MEVIHSILSWNEILTVSILGWLTAQLIKTSISSILTGKLQLELHKALAAQGIRTERRRYVPHITLARGVISDAPACRIEPIRCHAGSFDLMLSEREGRGMRYTSLLSVPLGKAY